MQEGHRHLTGSLLLVAVAIAGLLSMHGLDPVVATIDAPTHPSHTSDADAEVDHHGAIGICLFIAVAAGLVLARLNLRRGAARSPLAARRTLLLAGPRAEVQSGPSLFRRWCVLRL